MADYTRIKLQPGERETILLNKIEGRAFEDALEALRNNDAQQHPSHADPRYVLRALLATSAPRKLLSRTGGTSLATDLTALHRRIEEDQMEPSSFKTFDLLTPLLLWRLADIDIWTTAVLVVILVQGSPCTPAPFDYAQGPEDMLVFTHRGVEGFHRKYFERRAWSGRAEQAWRQLSQHFDHGLRRWTQLPNESTLSQVQAWWATIEAEMHRTAWVVFDPFELTCEQHGFKMKVAVRRNLLTGGGYHPRHVLIAGFFLAGKVGEKDGELFKRMIQAVQQVFATQPDRLFLHAFSLIGSELEPWVFDRAGAYSGLPFDINKEPRRFVNLICGYHHMSDEDLGLNPLCVDTLNSPVVALIRNDGSGEDVGLPVLTGPISRRLSITGRSSSRYIAKTPSGSAVVIKYCWIYDSRITEITMLQRARERGVRGIAKLFAFNEDVMNIAELRRGLTFSPVYHPEGGVVSTPVHTDEGHVSTTTTQAHGTLAPFSPEPDNAGSTSAADQHHRSNKRSLSISSSRSGPQTKRVRAGSQSAEVTSDNGGPSHLAEALYNSLPQPDNGPGDGDHGIDIETVRNRRMYEHRPYDDRVLRVVAIEPVGMPLRKFQNVLMLLESIHDAISAHSWLLHVGRILHRDISAHNIIITRPEMADNFRGMLIDLEWAKDLMDSSEQDERKLGTQEFMAIGVLRGESHTYRHDLESFFYVLLWMCASRAWQRDTDSRQPFWEWIGVDDDDCAGQKTSDMTRDRFEEVLDCFEPACAAAKPLCRRLRDILFPSLVLSGHVSDTPPNSRWLYSQMLDAFAQAINHIATGSDYQYGPLAYQGTFAYWQPLLTYQ